MTLEEVIKVMNVCDETQRLICIECPYAVDCKDVPGKKLRADALYYLQKYQEHYKARNDQVERYQKAAKDCEEILTDYVALKQWWTEQQENPPLSWDELKQMEGKPVWIELLNHDMWDDPSHRVDSEWWVIGEVRKDDIILATYLDEMELCEEDIGVLWKAYRKERK